MGEQDVADQRGAFACREGPVTRVVAGPSSVRRGPREFAPTLIIVIGAPSFLRWRGASYLAISYIDRCPIARMQLDLCAIGFGLKYRSPFTGTNCSAFRHIFSLVFGKCLEKGAGYIFLARVRQPFAGKSGSVDINVY